jgi:DNA-directed RNA polymerase subunit beta'
MAKVETFDAIKIQLASPQQILAWSTGEVVKPETINYRTQRPEKDGLFAENIFGPTKDYECYCGKYKRIRYKGVVCDKCGVEVTKSSVRRERMGHIKLATPVAHIWFLRGIPSRIGLLVGRSVQEVEKVIYFVSYIIISVDDEAKKRMLEDVEIEFKAKKKEKNKKDLEDLKKLRSETIQEINSIKKGAIITETDYRILSLKYGAIFKAGTGAEAIRRIFEEMNLEEVEKKLETLYEKASQEARKKIRQRLSLLRKFSSSGVRPEWMCMTHLPVLPPDLRPMVQLDGGRYASSDLNDLYRRVINRNNRLKYLKEIDAPEVITRNEKRMLQEAVDALIDNQSRKKPQQTAATTGGKRELKSLADMLKGKQGRFRQNLLGKRVDYSGRSVIVVGPELKLDEVGIPKKMALELFKPFIIHKIIEAGLAHNVRGAGILISEEKEEVWEILGKIIKGKHVLLNRAPTLHRLSVQAFKPTLIEGNALQLHPLVCPAFNADFDGDQMAVFLPLSKKAQKEAAEIMVSTKGILKPATGKPIAIPRQEMVLGCYFLTNIKPGVPGEGKVFSSPDEAKIAWEFKQVNLQAKIKVPLAADYFNGKEVQSEDGIYVETSVGRLIFNDILPANFPYQNELKDSKKVQKMISQLMEMYPHEQAIDVLDAVKNLGFEYSTVSCTTWGMQDLIVPKEKEKIVLEADKKEEEIKKQYFHGFLSERERKDKIIEIWQEAKNKISDKVLDAIPKHGSVFSIINSGARGSWAQPFQMAGMKGLVANPAGETMELPVKKSYQEGLNTLEYFISTHGARKGTVDTALRTSSAGYLTRRLVDVAHDLIIRDIDCKDKKGIIVTRKDAEAIDQDFAQKLIGRIVVEDVKIKNKVIVKKGEIIDEKQMEDIEKAGIDNIAVRSPLSCKSLKGICQKCYGMDLTTHKPVKLGCAVGVIAAQAIGEPGTQLTMRTFHTGGVAGIGDITLGLPRVEEIFEARIPKGEAPIFEEAGKVTAIKEDKTGIVVEVRDEQNKKKEYKLPPRLEVLVKEGEKVAAGQPLIEGRIDIKKLFNAAGKEESQRYVLNEIQKIYTEEGVSIHDKHLETIIHQIFSRVKITISGDSDLSRGEILSQARFHQEVQKMEKEKKEPPKAKTILLGLTKVALSTDSFLSAASFQETSKILIQAAIEGRQDKLEGLKENVIIGKIIPAGTGFEEKTLED